MEWQLRLGDEIPSIATRVVNFRAIVLFGAFWKNLFGTPATAQR
jgi:hypothetical protein